MYQEVSACVNGKLSGKEICLRPLVFRCKFVLMCFYASMNATVSSDIAYMSRKDIPSLLLFHLHKFLHKTAHIMSDSCSSQ
jgi:hypothetical protein